MDITDFIPPERIVVALKPRDKPQLLAELSRRAAGLLGIAEADIVGALSAREQLGSTGIGGGIALPHAKIRGVTGVFGLFAQLDKPIEYAAIDGRAVDLVCLLLTPEGGETNHLAALACVARRLRDDKIVKILRGSRQADQIYAALAGNNPTTS